MIFVHDGRGGSDVVSGPSACAQRRIPSNGKILFEAENLCFGGTYGPDQEEVAGYLSAGVQKHRINILTCSTTMEMGVDLGDLELVEMNSVPPHPANYKQRAGRSGRKGQYHSAAITLCGSDAVGLRTMQNPCQNLIARPFDIPKVDLNSPQLVKRHIAAFMIRSVGDRGNAPRLNDRIIDFFTPYMFDDDREREVVDSDFNSVGPARGLCLDSDETSFLR